MVLLNKKAGVTKESNTLRRVNAKNEFNQINSGLEGYKKADWIIADYGKVAVHIFSEKARDKFNIEKLWR